MPHDSREPGHEIFLKFLLENFDKGNRWLRRLINKLNQTSGNSRPGHKGGERQPPPPEPGQMKHYQDSFRPPGRGEI
jgi:hypothetical protein